MTEQKNSETDKQFNYSNHIVAFLDLLGQKDKLLKIDGLLDNLTDIDSGMATLLPVLKDTIGAIRSFRKSFKDYFYSYVNHQPVIDIPDQIRSHFMEMRGRSEIKLQSFSDTTIAWSPIQPTSEVMYAQALNSVHGIIASVGMISPLYLSKGFPIRGGIEIEGGVKIEPDEDEIYGPVLNRAYALECKKAQYPRVLIGEGLVSFLEFFNDIKFKDKAVERYCKDIASYCWKWIVRDDDDLLMVHFLGPASLEYSSGAFQISDYYRDILVPIKEYITESINRFQSNKADESSKLCGRYKRLDNYYERYINDWKT